MIINQQLRFLRNFQSKSSSMFGIKTWLKVEGPYDKCKDYELRGDPKEYYSLIMEAASFDKMT